MLASGGSPKACLMQYPLQGKESFYKSNTLMYMYIGKSLRESVRRVTGEYVQTVTSYVTWMTSSTCVLHVVRRNIPEGKVFIWPKKFQL
jgi:hypothetical protein